MERSHQGSSPSWFASTPPWFRAVLLAAPVYVIWMATLPRATPWHRVVVLGYLILLQGIVAGVLWRAAKRADYPNPVQQALRWVAAGWFLNFFSTIALPVAAVFQKNEMAPGLVDLGYLSSYVLTFIGLSKFPRNETPYSSVWRMLLDGAAFLVGVGVPLWMFAIHPALQLGVSLQSTLGVIYPIMAFLGVMGLNLVLLRCPPIPNRPTFHVFLLGIGTSWAADLVFSLQLNGVDAFPGLRSWNNICNALSLVLCLIGSWRLLRDPLPKASPRPAHFSPIPMITIVLVSLWLLRIMRTGLDRATIQSVLTGVVLLIIVLLLRETLAFKDSLRQATEEVTLELRARFEALVRHSSDLILVIDRKGVIAFASPASRRVLGSSAESLIGHGLQELLHQDDAIPTSAFLEQLSLHPGEPLSHQCRMRHVDGAWKTLEISGSNLLDDPSVGGLVLNTRDITDRHHLEDQLREAQKLEAVGRLAGGVAHDFNNLLGAIMGSLGLAEASLPMGHPSRKDLIRIQGAATRGAALTGRLLAFCRRELPKSKVVNPEAIIQGLVPLLHGLLGERVHLNLELDPLVGTITVDPHELEQALLNMAANSRDAMSDGGTLTIRLMKGSVAGSEWTHHLVAVGGDTVSIEVMDTGQGMDENVQEHLFEPFFTTKGRGRGTGLGLASIYGMVKASHGSIQIKSAPGLGTTIRLTFPKADGVADRDVSGSSTVSDQGTETILLVEDESDVRETTHQILESRGYTVIAAPDAGDARQQLQHHRGSVHLLLTDVIMPGESGPSLAADLILEYPELRVLYISGYTANELGPHGLARPDAPLLRKPFTINQLTRALREVLGGPPGQI